MGQECVFRDRPVLFLLRVVDMAFLSLPGWADGHPGPGLGRKMRRGFFPPLASPKPKPPRT